MGLQHEVTRIGGPAQLPGSFQQAAGGAFAAMVFRYVQVVQYPGLFHADGREHGVQLGETHQLPFFFRHVDHAFVLYQPFGKVLFRAFQVGLLFVVLAVEVEKDRQLR